MKTATQRQKEVLRTIDRLSLHFPPTMREIGAEMGIQSKAVYDHLSALAIKRLVHWEPKKCRTLQITKAGFAAIGKKA